MIGVLRVLVLGDVARHLSHLRPPSRSPQGGEGGEGHGIVGSGTGEEFLRRLFVYMIALCRHTDAVSD